MNRRDMLKAAIGGGLVIPGLAAAPVIAAPPSTVVKTRILGREGIHPWFLMGDAGWVIEWHRPIFSVTGIGGYPPYETILTVGGPLSDGTRHEQHFEFICDELMVRGECRGDHHDWTRIRANATDWLRVEFTDKSLPPVDADGFTNAIYSIRRLPMAEVSDLFHKRLLG